MGPGVFQPEAGGQAEKLSGVPGGMATAGTPHVTGRIFDAVEITKKEAIRRGKQVDVQGAEEGMAKVRLGRGVDVDTAEPAASHAELDPEHPAVWGGMENEVPVEGRVEKHHTNTSATVNAKGEVGREVEAGREGLDVASGKEIDLLQEEEVAPAGQGEVEDFVLFLRAAETLNVEGDDAQVHEEGDERARSPTYCIEFSVVGCERIVGRGGRAKFFSLGEGITATGRERGGGLMGDMRAFPIAKVAETRGCQRRRRRERGREGRGGAGITDERVSGAWSKRGR